MCTRLILPLLVLAAVPAHATSPIAEVICAPRDEMVQRLTVQYRSSLAGMGVRNVDAVMEVWAAPDGEWTLVQTYTDGRSCIVAMGSNWDMIPRNPA